CSRRNVCGVARDAPKADLPDETFEILVLAEHSNGRLLLGAKEPTLLPGRKTRPVVPIRARHVGARSRRLGADELAVDIQLEDRARTLVPSAHACDGVRLTIEDRG